MTNISDDITRIIGVTGDKVQNLLDAIEGEDEHKASIARSALIGIPGITNELLASLKIANRLDRIIEDFSQLKKEHDSVMSGATPCRPMLIQQSALWKFMTISICVPLALSVVAIILVFVLSHK